MAVTDNPCYNISVFEDYPLNVNLIDCWEKVIVSAMAFSNAQK